MKRRLGFVPTLLLVLSLLTGLVDILTDAVLFQEYPPGCDEDGAKNCEREFLACRLFEGPADDPETMCFCGQEFFGSCLRSVGCQTSMQVSFSVNPTNYMQQCVALIMQYDCPSTLMCSINCASEGNIVRDNVLVMPFNNYGKYHLRIRFCTSKTHEQRYSRYSLVDQVPCSTLDDFLICSRWIPPLTFVPVAFVKNTTYMEVDSCEILDSGDPYCRTEDPKPARIYGNAYMFPRSYDVEQTTFSICSSDSDCLGSYCDSSFKPSICSPKSMVHVLNKGSKYFSDPFG